MSAISIVRDRLDTRAPAAVPHAVPGGDPSPPMPQCLVVRVEGELDVSVLEAFRRALTTALDSAPPILVVDLRHARFLSLRCGGALAEAVERAGRRGIELRVYSGRREIGRVLDIVGIRTTDAAVAQPIR